MSRRQSSLAVFPPEAVLFTAVDDLLITRGIALCHLDGPDQVGLVEAGVVFHSQIAGDDANFGDFHFLPPKVLVMPAGLIAAYLVLKADFLNPTQSLINQYRFSLILAE